MIFHKKNIRDFGWFFLVLAILLYFGHYAYAAPVLPTINILGNETMALSTGALINTTGGSITTMTLDATSQNYKWKAYVGNVTGNLVLQDANGYNIFDWSGTSSVTGEVYATRTSSSVSWSDINCSNSTHILNEEIALNHTSNPNDNISTTFSAINHTSMFIGTKEILQNSCYSIHTNVGNQSQNTSFEEISLYDGTNSTNGNIIYATKLEQDVIGYNNETYDFQMILPEVALDAFQSSTAYYFYVELT